MTQPERHQPAPAQKRTGRKRDTTLPSGRIRLEERDYGLLYDVFTFGAMLRSQIQELHGFGSVSYCNYRCKKLFSNGLLVKSLPILAPLQSRVTSAETVYQLGPAGVPIVASQLEWSVADVRRRLRNGTPAALYHALEIVNFKIALLRAVQNQPEIQIETFLPEMLCLHSYEKRAGTDKWKVECFKPDSLFVLDWKGKRSVFAVEIDLSHTASQEFLSKHKIHSTYLESGLFTQRYGAEILTTLVITPSMRRVDNLRALLEKQGGNRFLFSTFNEVKTHSLLATIWKTPGSESLRSLLDI